MIRQTGGVAWGAISTRSSPFSLAMARACGGGQDAELLLLVVDDPDLLGLDHLVDPVRLGLRAHGMERLSSKNVRPPLKIHDSETYS